MADVHSLATHIETCLPNSIIKYHIACDELTLEVALENLRQVCLVLRDAPELKFEFLMDVCGVDYLKYGVSEWETENATAAGFERGVDKAGERIIVWEKPRFAVVYHLLSITLNHRVRVKVFIDGEPPMVESVIDDWNSANWFERETFDLFGILFKGHPDLRRILTDYGFTGHPFRKDFPLIGNVEVRYDAAEQRVIYEPVSIEPRTLVPRVIRQDGRYEKLKEATDGRNS